MTTSATPLRIPLSPGISISAVLRQPDAPRACFVFAHGAGAGMNHPFMADLAAALEARGIATLRFQFPFMEQESKRTDHPAVAQQAVRAAVDEARARLPGMALFAGGKSFGGRMTSGAQADAPLAQVRGIIFVGFPLHPAGKPATERAAHLQQVGVPMLFLQGTRDALADLELMRRTTEAIGPLATLHVVDGADHAFHVLVRSGRNDKEVIEELAETVSRWITELLPSGP
jgi:predicted alpha/beta-hydrolase family hydrolase